MTPNVQFSHHTLLIQREKNIFLRLFLLVYMNTCSQSCPGQALEGSALCSRAPFQTSPGILPPTSHLSNVFVRNWDSNQKPPGSNPVLSWDLVPLQTGKDLASQPIAGVLMHHSCFSTASLLFQSKPFVHKTSLSQSEEAAGAERGSQEKEAEGGEGTGDKGGGRGGEAGGESEEEAAMETPTAPVYCICRRPDINCFMM